MELFGNISHAAYAPKKEEEKEIDTKH